MALLWRPLVGELLSNTLLLIACATLCCGGDRHRAGLGGGADGFAGATRLGGAGGGAARHPAFHHELCLGVARARGWRILRGALLVVTVSYYPLVYLPVAAALREMDPALEETARALGNSPWAVFLRVVLPQLRPALLGGMLLVALDTLVEFGAFALLRFRTFTTAIYAAYRAGFSGAEPALLAMVLLVLCIACLAAEYLVRGQARYGRLARGTRRGGGAAMRWGAGGLLVAAGFAGWAVLTHRRAAGHDRLLAGAAGRCGDGAGRGIAGRGGAGGLGVGVSRAPAGRR